MRAWGERGRKECGARSVNILWSTLGDGKSPANMPGAAEAARSGVSRRRRGSGGTRAGFANFSPRAHGGSGGALAKRPGGRRRFSARPLARIKNA